MEPESSPLQDERVLAETVSFTEEEILVIMLVLLGMLAVVVAIAVLGCIWAWRAGRGSQRALIGFVVVASLEGMASLAAVPALLEDRSLVFIGPVWALGAQVGLFLWARAKDGRAR